MTCRLCVTVAYNSEHPNLRLITGVQDRVYKMSDTEVNNIINIESYGDEPRTRPFRKRRSEKGYMAALIT